MSGGTLSSGVVLERTKHVRTVCGGTGVIINVQFHVHLTIPKISSSSLFKTFPTV